MTEVVPPQKARSRQTKVDIKKEDHVKTMLKPIATTASESASDLRLVKPPLATEPNEESLQSTNFLEDVDIRNLLPAVSAEGLSRLESDLIAHGCLAPLVVWKERGILIDGYQRLAMLLKHGITFKVVELSFDSIEAVRLWRWRINNRNRWTGKGEQIEWAIRTWKDYFETIGQQRRQMGRSSLGGKAPRLRWSTAVGQECSPPVSGDTVKAVWKGLQAVERLRQNYGDIVNAEGHSGFTEADHLLDGLRNGELKPARFDWVAEKAVRVRERDPKVIHKGIEQYHSPDGVVNTILKGDCREVLKVFPSDKVSLFVFSPPFNAGKDYGIGKEADDLPYHEHLDFLTTVGAEMYRTLRPGGRVVINLDSIRSRSNSEEQLHYHRPINADVVYRLRDIGFMPMTEIFWRKPSVGNHKTTWGHPPLIPAMRREIEYLLVFSKHSGDEKRPFHLVPDADSGRSDMNSENLAVWTNNVWDIPAETKGRDGHPCPYPEHLVERIIKLFSYTNDWVVDPFVGSGTTTAVAARHGRRWTGIDIVDKWCHDSLARTKEALSLAASSQ